ncbi:insulinase family protein, partial [Candidatus Woesearchaeota archaeon]|nr:insulinase family protein [Candidatus Woesearchaeota archaeon]
EATVYFITIPRKHFDTALDILADMLQNPMFDPKIIEKERKVILEEINLHTDDPKVYQWILFLKNLYEKHPTKNPIYGYRESMASITKNDILEYYNKYYHPNNMIISVVGNINNPLNKIKKSFNNKRNKEEIKKISVEEPKNRYNIAKEKRKIMHSYLVLGYKVPNRSNKEFYALEVIRGVLGRGQSGKLFNEIRTKRGLAYMVSIVHNSSLDYGYFAVYVGMDKKNIEIVKELILKELNNLKNINNKDMEDAKTYLEGNYLLENEDNRKEAINLADWEMIKDYSLANKYIKNIKRVTKKDIIKVVEEYLNEKYTLITIEP